jgi:insertion element IS1 protein InsB
VIACDELWSFVGDKQNQQWVWLALDRDSKDIVGCFIGSRDEEGAIGLWQSLPECYLDATTYTDFWEAYDAIFYDKTLHQVGKETGLTNHIERFNNTLRQRVSRLVRKTLSFSKKLENHIGAIWSFIHHYNATHARKALLP